MSRDPLRSVARRVRCPGTTAPPSEMLTPTDGLLRSATSTGRPTQLLRGDRRVLSEKKPKSSRLRARTKKPTAHKGVRYRQPCCRGRSARAAGTRTHPADATRWFETPPRKTRVHPVKSSSNASTAAVDPEGQPPLPSLWPPGDQADDRIGSVWMRGLTPRGKDACRALIRLPLLTRWHPSLMPLDRTQNAARARGCWRSSHDGRLT
jgi:hypothetical protein